MRNQIEIKHTIEGLDQLTEAIALVGAALAYKRGMAKTAEVAVDLMNEITDEVKAEAEIETEEVKTEKTEVESKFTREEVREAFVAKNSTSTRNKLKAILDKFDDPNISELKEEHFEDVMKELEAL